jgi:hypothetical protein
MAPAGNNAIDATNGKTRLPEMLIITPTADSDPVTEDLETGYGSAEAENSRPKSVIDRPASD